MSSTIGRVVAVVFLIGAGATLLDWESITGVKGLEEAKEQIAAQSAKLDEIEALLRKQLEQDKKAPASGVDQDELETQSAKLEEIEALLMKQFKQDSEGQTKKQDQRVREEASAASAPVTEEAPLTHAEWCPNARCHNTVLCKPCQRRFLIVVTEGRAASTTLTWMLARFLARNSNVGRKQRCSGKAQDPARRHHLFPPSAWDQPHQQPQPAQNCLDT